MLGRAVALCVSLLAVTSACSSSPMESASSTDESLKGGTPTHYPVVTVSVGTVTGGVVTYRDCTGTSIRDNLVLTAQWCGVDAAHPELVQVCTSPAQCAGVKRVTRSPNTAYAALLELRQPLAFASYPTLSTTALSSGQALTCASGTGLRSGALATEAPFKVNDMFSASIADILPTGGAILQDVGIGCFQGNTLVALVGKTGSAGGMADDASFLASWVASYCDAKCDCESNDGAWFGGVCHRCTTAACRCTSAGGYWNGHTCS